MKSLAIVGMMFLSMGLFAQTSRADSQVKEKDKVCVKKCDKAKKCDKMKLAPMQRMDSKKTILRVEDGNAVRKHKHVNSRKAHIQKRRMVVPLSKKSVKVDKKM